MFDVISKYPEPVDEILAPLELTSRAEDGRGAIVTASMPVDVPNPYAVLDATGLCRMAAGPAVAGAKLRERLEAVVLTESMTL